jgi:hypothetical protein
VAVMIVCMIMVVIVFVRIAGGCHFSVLPRKCRFRVFPWLATHH